jgi:cytochrome oxidase Cu insertion factor (SCO1/SenC/PrrC family)
MPVSRAAVAVAVVAAVSLALGCGDDDATDEATVVTAPAEGPFRGGKLPDPLDGAPAPPFRLADARGGEIDTRALAGRPYIVTFLYTRCRDICLTIGQEIGQALRLLERDERVVALAVSVDPEGDTPARVRRWLHEQRLPQNFRYLIGTRRELRPVWKSYYAAAQPEHSDESRHTTSIWLVDGRGRLRTKFSAGVPVPPADIAHDLRLLLRERAGP